MGHANSHANGGGQLAVAYAIQERAVSENPAAGPQGKGWQEDVSFTLEARNNAQAVAFQADDYSTGSFAECDVAATLTAGTDRTRAAPLATIPTVNGWTVRKLTPRECERLQGFPDDFTAIRWRGKSAPDGPRYKALGNSMAVNVMRWIGARIALIERAVEEAAGQGKS
ncbi:DNA cytosine methyltransferase [Tsuneonella suprasediminis]|uniref:DNA cytosine methyltransferase n=1 Tax=Tsuneonella suprasediminis TaxID=2306996 RepID=UPI002F953138